MDQPVTAQAIPTDPKALVAGIISKSLQFDAPAAVQLLFQVQAGYDSKAIGEQDYQLAQAELIKAISPQEPTPQVQAPQGSSERLQALYRQKADIVRILDGLADAVSSGKVSDADYEKLHVSNNARLLAVQSRIDADASGQPRVVAVQRREVTPQAIILASSASKPAQLPARAQEIKQELSEAAAMPSQEPAVDKAWASKYEKSLSELESSEKRMRDEASQFKGTLESLYSKLSNIESQVANLQTETGYIGKDVSKFKVAGQPEASSKDVEAKLSALSNEFEGRILELSSRLSNSETQMAQRLAEIRALVDKVDQFRQAMDLAAESARQVQEIQLQVDRAERVAALLGKTFVNSQRKFDDLDALGIRQSENEAKLAALAQRVSAMESMDIEMPASAAPAQPAQGQDKAASG